MFNALIAYIGALIVTMNSSIWMIWLGALPPLYFFVEDSDDKEPGFFSETCRKLAFIGLVPGVASLVNWAISARILKNAYFANANNVFTYIGVMLFSSICVFLTLRYVPQAMNKAKSKITKKNELERNKKTDVREIHKMLPDEIGAFDPTKYFKKPPFNPASPPQSTEGLSLFVGLDEEKQPVYVDYDAWKISHCLLTGRTRSGKGVAAQILLGQAIQYGEFLVMLDPKKDNFMPAVYKKMAEDAGLPYHYVDLNQSAGLQLNLFEGCNAETIENMLIGSFSLTEKGDSADFYRLGDRKAARRAAAWFAQNPGATARDCIAAIGDAWADEAAGFLAAMQELAEVDAVNRPSGTGGIDIASGVQTGGVLYVVGDMINTRIIRLQRMILLRLLFLAKNRDPLNLGRTITVFADEFKVHISRPFMTSLGASAGWGLHTILAFQSLQDLADCPADLDKDMVRGAVMENCSIQLSYAIKDPETAEWLAASTGTVLVDDESRQVRKNVAQAELVEGNRNIRQADRYLIDTNMLMHMPKGCGVLSVVGRLPSFCYTSPVKVDRTPAATTPTAPALPAPAKPAAGAGAVAAAAALGSVAAASILMDEPERHPATAGAADTISLDDLPDPSSEPEEEGYYPDDPTG